MPRRGRDGCSQPASRPREIIVVVALQRAGQRCSASACPRASASAPSTSSRGRRRTVVFFSMASSSGEDVPRGLEFLLSRNRLNVAISRARCLAYLVASPRLLEVNCHTIPQMRLANALCRFVELAGDEVKRAVLA